MSSMFETEVGHDSQISQLTISGARTGPLLAVKVGSEQAAQVVSRLSSLPSLAYLQGALVVGCDPLSQLGEAPDATLDLTAIHDPVDIFWTLLAKAAGLGMIAGRGVPSRYLSTPEAHCRSAA